MIRSGLGDVRFHDLRHTAATIMIMNGTDIVTVSKILGHSNIEMTMRYSHPTTDEKMDVVNGIEMQIRGHDDDTLAKVDTTRKVKSNLRN